MSEPDPATSPIRAALRGAHDELRARWVALLADLRSRPPESLRTKPDPDRWTLIEVAHHLALAEQGLLQGLPPIDELRAAPRGLADGVKRRLVALVVRTGLRVPVPNDEMRPDPDVDLETVAALRMETDAWLTHCIDTAPDATLSGAICTHPIAGALTLLETLRLGAQHIDTHARKAGIRLA